MPDASADLRVIFRGRKIDLALKRVTLSDGSTAEREVVLHRGAVALLVLPDPDHLVLIRNRRYAVDETLIEVPAGTIDPGETPERTASREVREETGYDAATVERLAEWFVSPGVMNERMYLIAARDLTPCPMGLQPDEQLQPFTVTWDEALGLAAEGLIRDAKTLVALAIGRGLYGADSNDSRPPSSAGE